MGVPASAASLNKIIRDGGLPEEVFRRFHSEVVPLAYPDAAEIAQLLATDADLQTACAQSGQRPDAAALRSEMELNGMSALTSFKTSALLSARRVARAVQPTR